MRSLLSVSGASVFAIAVSAILACGNGFAAGSLGKVEIERGEPIELRALLSGSVVTGISPLLETAVGLAIEDFGPIHGHPVSLRTLDEKCTGEGGRAAAEAVVADRTAGFQGLIGTLTCDKFGDCGTGRAAIRLHADSNAPNPLPLPVVYRGARDPHRPPE